MDRTEAHVIMFDREHVEAQRIKSRTTHRKAIVAVIPSDHPTDPQLVAMAKQYFLKHDKMSGQA